jgi:hypothetical protein
MLKGECVKCGKVYYGWALVRNSEHVCTCGASLQITQDATEPSGTVGTGLSEDVENPQKVAEKSLPGRDG